MEGNRTETHKPRPLPVGCVVLAAGASARFGENKLLAPFRGQPLIRRALTAVPARMLAAAAVVTRFDEIKTLAEGMGFLCVWNPCPALGQSHSVRLGVESLAGACPGLAGILFLPADQPLLRRESAEALLARFWEAPQYILAAASGGVRGSPCVFPAWAFSELLDLTGDTGGGAVIRRHPEALRLMELPAPELRDADTPAALRALETLGED